MILAPWCELKSSEEWVKDQTGPKDDGKMDEAEAEEASKQLTGAAKTLCVPIMQSPMPEGQMCFTGNGEPASAWALWGRSY
jgi:hypothetical protein